MPYGGPSVGGCSSGATVTVGGVTAEIMGDPGVMRKGSSLMGTGPWREITYQIWDGDGGNAWELADQFIDGLFDKFTVIGGPGSSIIYPNPHRYPGNERLVALQASAVNASSGRGGGHLVITDLARVEVAYGVPEYDIFGIDYSNAFGGQAVPFAVDRTRGYTQNYRVTPGTLEDSGTGDPIAEESDRIVPQIEYQRSLLGIPYFYDTLLKALVGRVNQYPFFGHDTGTLRFDTYDSELEKLSDGTRAQRYDLRFIWRPYDWNWVPKAGSLDWVPADDGSGNTTYLYGNFGPLAYGIV